MIVLHPTITDFVIRWLTRGWSFIFGVLDCRIRPFFRYLSWRVEYGQAAPKPYATITVDPDTIERSSTHHQDFFTYLVPHTYKSANKSGTHIVDGRWDDREWLEANATDENGREPLWAIEDDHRFVTAKQLLREGIPEDETAAYRELPDAKASKLCSNINAIAESIRELGYRSQSDLKESHPEHYHTPFYLPESYDEILVAIDREGEMLVVTNITRLIVAQLLDIDRVPVRVVVRHREWQAKRAAHSSGDMTGWPDGESRSRSHPDFQKLL